MGRTKPEDKTKRGIRDLFGKTDPQGGEAVIGRRNLPNMPGTIPDGGNRKMPSIPGTIPDGKSDDLNAKLSELKPGQSGVVATLHGNAHGRLRLMEMGLTPGVQVKVLHAAAFGGPLQISVRGYQLSLRREEASAVVLG
jgi:ferrous iron transport protein A